MSSGRVVPVPCIINEVKTKTEAAQASKSVLSPLCPQGVEDTFLSKAQVPPAAEMKPDRKVKRGESTQNQVAKQHQVSEEVLILSCLLKD